VLASYKSAGMITPSTTVVTAIGSNDTYDAKNGCMRWQVDNVERVIGRSQPVVWVDILNWSLSRGVTGQRVYALGTWTVNLQLWDKDTQYPNLRVARWNAMIRGTNKKYLSDQLHTNAYGNTARNDLTTRTAGPLV
jgi:hypothetical protein